MDRAEPDSRLSLRLLLPVRPSSPLRTRERLADPGQKRALNEQLFTVVAPSYDAVTRVLSLDRDRVWKERLVEALPAKPAPVCLDLACGTGDLREVIAEVHRVLRPGGTGSFLEFSKPCGKFPQMVEHRLLKAWGALWGWVFHRDPEV